MKRTMRVLLDIEISDLSAETRKECATGGMMSEQEIPHLRDYIEDGDEGLREIASCLETIGSEDASSALFAGSDVYIQTTKCRVVTSEWLPPRPTTHKGEANG